MTTYPWNFGENKLSHTNTLSVIHYKICGAVCFQFTHLSCDDWENIYTLSYYHHQIRSMNYYPLFRVRSWKMVSAVCLSIFLQCLLLQTKLQFQFSTCMLCFKCIFHNNDIRKIWFLMEDNILKTYFLFHFISYFPCHWIIFLWIKSTINHRKQLVLNTIKILSCQCRNSHYKDKMVVRPSYLYNGNPCTWKKMVFILKQTSANKSMAYRWWVTLLTDNELIHTFSLIGVWDFIYRWVSARKT